MPAARRRTTATEIEHLADLDAALASGEPLTGLRLQDLDLTAHEDRLMERTDVEGLVVLGGRLPPRLDQHLRTHHALVFPTDPHAPVNPYRATLYSPEDLYAGLADGYPATPDYRAYEWARDGALRHDAFVTLLRAIHDDSVSDALTEFIGGHRVVGVMGGHALPRDSSGYAAAALLGHELAEAGLLVVTGGGPGAMEGANLGAFARDRSALDASLARLSAVPSFLPSVEEWATLALEVRAELSEPPPGSGGAKAPPPRSIGIPTWHYGHEPPNVFCHGIAKYFSNAIREDGLLARCTAGLVVLQGAAGTVQEIFQAVTPLFYAAEAAVLPPLVLVGREHWTSSVPVWAALRAMAGGRAMADVLHLVDTPDEATAVITAAAGRARAGAP
jgi:predicted Rossmann-fold nucleotide-binding protein